LLRHSQVRIDPLVFFIQPNLPMARVAPTRGRWQGYLVTWVTGQIIPGRDEGEHLLVVIGFAHKEIEKLGAFIPPMAKKLCVVRANYYRWAVHHAGQFTNLLQAYLQKMLGMFIRCMDGGSAIVNLFAGTGAGDAMIFDPCERALVVSRQVRP